EAARRVGRRAGEAVGEVVARCKRAGLAAVEPRHGGGRRVKAGAAERERILAAGRRTPDRARGQTARGSLTPRPRALRSAAAGLPAVSTATRWGVLPEADLSWQRDRSWGHTGRAGPRPRPGRTRRSPSPGRTGDRRPGQPAPPPGLGPGPGQGRHEGRQRGA